MRREYPVPPDLLVDLADAQPQAGPAQDSPAVREMVERLPEPEKSAIEALFWEQVTLVEFGERYGRSKAWAHKVKSRALVRLSGMLEGSDE